MSKLEDFSDALKTSADFFREQRKQRGMYAYAKLYMLSEKGVFDLFTLGYRLSRLDAEYDFGDVSSAIQFKALGSPLTEEQQKIIEELRKIA